ncbi:MAG: HupE/UreJ family protein [Verrucomicrobia bacterium]|nr:HupE/UreJ family protein [Verrucomicrobiota bacterium]MDA1067399.1 HupE/UreJ family protein [Verrucomicrobiota bacterium]
MNKLIYQPPRVLVFVIAFFLFGHCGKVAVEAHKLESGQAVLTITPDFVWILEAEINLTRYIQSNPDLADTVRPTFRKLEKDGVFNDQNFGEWETVFSVAEAQFRKELQIIESDKPIDDFEMWFQHPSELSEASFSTMGEGGLHVKVYATGRLDEEASTLQFRFPLDIGEVVLTALKPEVQWVVTGELSHPVSIKGLSQAESVSHGIVRSLWNYLRVGFVHIIPLGLDHILFVVGLFLLAPKVRPLLIQVSAFTIAHTLTLALSMYGVISLSSNVVEPLIALSIASVAFENIITDKIQPWRPVLVFFFGLLHGLGFAGALGEIGLPQSEFLFALIFFNLGVEFGQLMVVVCAFIIIGSFRNRCWYRSRLTVPASCLIGLTGLYWTIQRIFF